MFRRITADPADFVFRFGDAEVPARHGETVAVALLAAGFPATRRTAANAAPRGPYCLMGACFDCLAEVDGIGSVQTCMIPARPGMVVRMQMGVRGIDEEDLA